MKARWKVMVVLAAAGGLCAFLLWRSGDRERKVMEETRRALRQQGFKTDLGEFDLSADAEIRARTAALTFAGPRLQRPPIPEGDLELMEPVGPNSARVIWQGSKLASYSGEDVWPALRESFNEIRTEL